MSSPILSAIKQISEEKGISVESVVATIEAALAAAYRKDFGDKLQNIKVEFDPKTGGSRVFDVKTVMEAPPEEEIPAEEAASEGEPSEVIAAPAESESAEEISPEDLEPKFNPKLNIAPEEAQKIKPGAAIGDEIKMELEIPSEYGRMAAQTAKQVITQKLREVERQTTFDEFKTKEHEILNGIVQRREGRVVLVDMGRATGIMFPEDQIPSEMYKPGMRVKVCVVSVTMGTKGPEIRVSRAHPDIVRRLFSIEIPEISNGLIEVKSVAREAGFRSKVAVESKDESIDPIGSCVGQRGTRVQTIISEIGGEKIDIIEWDEDPKVFITNALSPAKVSRLELNEAEKVAKVIVKPDQLSLAIGRGGQNVRLASKLTGWRIDIAEEKEGGEAEIVPAESETPSAEEAAPKTSATEEKPAVEEKPKAKKRGRKKKEEAPSEEETSAEKSEEEKETKE